MMRKKRIYTVAAVCLLVFLYMMIFLLSSDVAEDSSMKSSAVTELLLKIWSFFQNSDGTPTTEIVVDLFPLALEKIVRKLAHFFEYLCVGLLSYSLVLMWWKGKVWSGRQMCIRDRLMKDMGKLAPEERAGYGKSVNELKTWAFDKFADMEEKMKKLELQHKYEREKIDLTIPAEPVKIGNLHPVTLVRNQLIDIFAGMGF